MFYKKVAVLKLVRHQNIIRLRNVFETRKQIHIVTAFVSGGDLFDRIVERVRYTERAAQALMRKLFEAVRLDFFWHPLEQHSNDAFRFAGICIFAVLCTAI